MRQRVAQRIGWLAATVLVVFLIDGGRLDWQNWEVSPRHNINLAEALAWRAGTLELSGYQRESAKFGGRQLNAFPPGFSIISYAVLSVMGFITGEESFPPWLFRLVVGLPTLLIAFWAAQVCTRQDSQAALLTICFLLGTPMLAMLTLCRIGGFFEVNHVLACCGILLIVGDVLGQRRVWPALTGLALSFWTRQLTLLYLLAILWSASQLPRPRRVHWCVVSAAAAVVVVGVYCGLNWLKFGSPWETGYRYIYEGRTDAIAQRARRGLFRPEFFPDNFYFMMFEPPGIRLSDAGIERATNDHGAGIWLTCPVLLAVVLTARQWWRERGRRLLMLLSFGVMLMLLMYHTTGWRQPGYSRFSLDFIPVWLMVAAPYLWGRYRTWLNCACIAWSVWYFRFITFDTLAWVRSAA